MSVTEGGPQFIDRDLNFALQFSLMGMTYGLLIIVIHGLYALGAQRTRPWLTSETGGFVINRVGGAIFVVFADKPTGSYSAQAFVTLHTALHHFIPQTLIDDIRRPLSQHLIGANLPQKACHPRTP